MDLKDKTKDDLLSEVQALRSKIEALEQSRTLALAAQEPYQTIIRTAMDGFLMVDAEGRFIDVNDAYCTLTGYSREELLNMRVSDVEAVETPAQTADHIQKVIKNGYDRFETRHRRKDGLVLELEVSVNFTPNDGGIFFSFLRDVTERKKAQDRLAILSHVVEQNPMTIMVTAKDGTIEYVNPQFTVATGYSAEEAIGKKPSLLKSGRHEPEFYEKLWQTILGGNAWRGDIYNRKKDGSIFRELLYISPIKNEKGEITHFVSLKIDDTDRRIAEENTLREKKFAEALLNSMPGIFYLFDSKGKFVRWNKKMEEVSGYNAEELSRMTTMDLVSEKDRNVVLGKTAEVFAKGGSFTEADLLSKDGTATPYFFTGVKLDISGSPHVIGMGIDITERKRLEQDILKAQKLESLSVLAGGIAHDFNNLLTGIYGNISLARLYVKPGGKVHDILEQAEHASIRAKELTLQLLTFAKGGSPVKTVANIARLLRDEASFPLRGSNVKCEFYIPEKLSFAEIDAGQIAQVIHNLVINAAQAMPGGGTVKVRAEDVDIATSDALPVKNGRYIKISIEDNGIGIQQEHLQRIFDPYFTTKQTGSGLGLATVYSILRKHDGHITVRSKAGVGTTFDVYLPAANAPAAAVPEERAKSVTAGSGRVLVMDDEDLIREFAAALLPSLGYSVWLAKDGEEAIAMYKKSINAGEPFDAVIMDLTVPGAMGGKEAVKKLLAIDPKAKVIVSSGYSNDPIMSEYAKYGFKDVIVKPYKVADLSDTLGRVIHSASNVNP